MAEPFTSKNWRVWVQPDGPNTDMEMVGCIDSADISESGGGIKDVIRCFRADGSGWDVLATTRNPPDQVTTTLTGLVETTANWLELLKESACPFPLYFNGRTCPPHDVFVGAPRTYAYQEAEIAGTTLAGLAMREEDVETTLAAEITAWPPGIVYRAIVGARQTIAEYSALNDIHFCNAQQCAGPCGATMGPCTIGVAVSSAPAGSPAVMGDVWYTIDGGVTWTATVADPFAAAEDIWSGICFPISDTVARLLVAREADPATAAEVAYSDDWGANWTLVVLGTPVNVGALDGDALFALDMYNIWYAMSDGHIAFSNNGGETWTMQQVGAGKLTANDLYAIWFADNQHGMAVGQADTVLVTSDGGTTWATGTATGAGAILYAVTENDGGGIWWVGTTTGRLYYSTDQGTTWTQRTFGGTATVNSIRFANTLAGFLADGLRLFRTKNGGRDWELISVPTNLGLAAVHACTENMVYAVGSPQPAVGGTAVIVKASG